ncbi:MAG: hypothetical protein C0412_15150 [Flavobacterium sp.]|nr:hypothetical protein [Flavobacterium sp.]
MGKLFFDLANYAVRGYAGDSESYFQTVEKYFGKKLKCKVDVLYLSKTNLSKSQVRDKILSPDIIYVGHWYLCW